MHSFTTSDKMFWGIIIIIIIIYFSFACGIELTALWFHNGCTHLLYVIIYKEYIVRITLKIDIDYM